MIIGVYNSDMALVWIIIGFAALGFIGWVYGQIQEYLEQERSKQRDEIAVNVISDAGISNEVKTTVDKLFGYVINTIPRSVEETEEYEIVTPVVASSIRDNLCPKCGLGFMVRRNGQYGSFLGCTRYPQCKSTKQMGWVNSKAKAIQKKAKEKQKNQYSKQFMEDLKKAYN